MTTNIFSVGDQVAFYQHEEGIMRTGKVISVDPTSEFAGIEVEWTEMAPVVRRSWWPTTCASKIVMKGTWPRPTN